MSKRQIAESGLSADSLSVRGSDKVRVPAEIKRYFEGKGISAKFLDSHYGYADSLEITPTASQVKARLTRG